MTRVILQIRSLGSTESTFHVDEALMREGVSGRFISLALVGEGVYDQPTAVGQLLVDYLKELPAIDFMFGQYAFRAEAPKAFIQFDVLWAVMEKLVTVIDGDIFFAVVTGDNWWLNPDLVENPTEADFIKYLGEALSELGERTEQAPMSRQA